ncbi:MAG: hypothetical protein AAB427_12440 [Chloroflexota bacterium]
MTVYPIMLHLPDTLYRQIKERAEQAKRTVEAELLEVVARAVPAADRLPDDLQTALDALATLDDDALQRAAQSRLPGEASAEMERLNLKRQREGLTELEHQSLMALARQYERNMLVRAQSAVLLKERGHDISALSRAA